MKVRLVKNARCEHMAGEVVETTPACASILIGNGMAVLFVEEAHAEAPKEAKPKKTTKKKVTE